MHFQLCQQLAALVSNQSNPPQDLMSTRKREDNIETPKHCSPTYCSHGLKERLNMEQAMYYGVPLAPLPRDWLPSLDTPARRQPLSDSLDNLASELQERSRKDYGNRLEKKEDTPSMSRSASPEQLKRIKSTVGEAGKMICSPKGLHRDNHLDDILKYCKVSPADRNYPLCSDEDLHMRKKLGYANEKAMQQDMQREAAIVPHPLIGKYLKNLHQITF